MTHFKLLTFLIVLFASLTLSAQEPTKYRKKADPLYDAHNYYAAIDEYKAAFSKEKNKAEKAEINFRLAVCYYEIKQMKRAIRTFDKCVSYKYADENPIVYLYLGWAHKSLGQYEDALTHFNTYNEMVPTDKRGANGAKSCQLAIKWKLEPQRYKVTNMAMLNSKDHDVAPAYAGKKNNKLVFSSSRSGSQGESESEKTGQATPALYFTELDRKGKWSKPSTAPFEETVNTKSAEGAPTFDSRKSTLYFTRCDIPQGKKGIGYCYIYSARKKGPTNYGETEKVIKLDSVNIAHPTLSQDGKTIYFAAKMDDGYGGYDIYKAEYDRKTRTFSAPVNLGPQINTSMNEMYPFIHADGTLYFSSNGHMGMGGYDIFKVESTNGAWGPVVNMKYPINSEGDDVSIIFEDNVERGFLSSSRAGGKGNLDLYSFVLPKLEFMVTGVVRDMETKEILPNSTVVLVGSDGSSLEFVTDASGAYEFKLSPITNYVLGAKNAALNKQNKQKYFASDDIKLTTVGEEQSKNFTYDIELEPIPLEAIALPNVLYKTGDTTLLPESKIALNGLVGIMKRNENMTIKIFSHTDFRGSDANNQKLSRGRANSVVAYLVEKGIDVERLDFEGKGESDPRKVTEANAKDLMAICKQFKVEYEGNFKVGDVLSEAFINSLPSKNLKMAAHQFNRRTEFTITGYDYVSAAKKATGN